MNSENFFKSPAKILSAAAMTMLLAMSLNLSGQMSVLAADAKAAAKKTEKSAQDKNDASDKSDKSDKKDEKAADKDKATDKSKETAKTPEPVIENVVSVAPEDLVDKPHEYLGKNVKFSAPFFAFSNLALDYKPAFRSSKTHISLLVSRSKKHVPLSELKLAMMTPKEKDPETTLLANLKEGDTLEIIGKVFSTALDDPWVEILKVKKTGGAPDDKKADAAGKAKNDTKASGDAKNDKSGSGKSESDKK
ncbi:MAG: hypothetical protein K2X27_28110 [Candidatus Obscuribacterales bacterium]|nr:hypothetical protein [Candidatus Obscuribacterales bacterium]